MQAVCQAVVSGTDQCLTDLLRHALVEGLQAAAHAARSQQHLAVPAVYRRVPKGSNQGVSSCERLPCGIQRQRTVFATTTRRRCHNPSCVRGAVDGCVLLHQRVVQTEQVGQRALDHI